MGNYAADRSLKGGDEFTTFVRRLAELGRNTARHLDATHAWLGGIKNPDLLLRWRDFYCEMADRFVVAPGLDFTLKTQISPGSRLRIRLFSILLGSACFGYG